MKDKQARELINMVNETSLQNLNRYDDDGRD